MRSRLFVRALPLLCLPFASACVSETRGPGGELLAEDSAEDGKSPLEQAEERVRAHLAVLERSTGKDLLGVVDRIVSYKEIALRPIAERMETGDSRVRSLLVYVLGRIDGTYAHAQLTARLSDPDPVVRFEAASALVDDADLSGVPLLVKALREPDRKLRFKAIEALRRLTKQDFGYDFAADEPGRERAVAAWDSWWAKTRAELLYVGAPGSYVQK